MKIFQRYNPLRVAKLREDPVPWTVVHQDVGAFEFDKGKILSRK